LAFLYLTRFYPKHLILGFHYLFYAHNFVVSFDSFFLVFQGLGDGDEPINEPPIQQSYLPKQCQNIGHRQYLGMKLLFEI